MTIANSTARLLLIIYGVLLTIVLIYFRFPTDEFNTFCAKKFELTFTNTACKIGRIHYGFPTSIVFEKVVFQKLNREQQAVFTIDKITLRPAIKFWNTFKLSGILYAGTVKSTLGVNWENNGYKLTDIVLSALSLQEIIKDQGIVNREITGSLSGSGQYQNHRKLSTATFGKIRMVLESGSFEVLQPILGLAAIDFKRIVVDLLFGEQLELQQGQLSGKDIRADFAGTIYLRNNLPDSSVILSGHIQPKREFLQKNPEGAKFVKQYAKRYKSTDLPFKLAGTLSHPTFRFSR
ncbi:MAG: type II secretion system protein GspN [Desulfotalea sp.]|nr:MAG: type II secretion system protein GspN [Desulfotalea sp.]